MNISQNSKAQLVNYFSGWTEHCSARMIFLISDIFMVSSVLLGAAFQSYLSNTKCYPWDIKLMNVSKYRHKMQQSKGKCNGKFYCPQKWSLDIYFNCDSMNEYIFSLTFPIMEGPQQTAVHPDLPITSWTVIHLVQLLQSQTGDRGRHGFTDRFYLSPQ